MANPAKEVQPLLFSPSALPDCHITRCDDLHAILQSLERFSSGRKREEGVSAIQKAIAAQAGMPLTARDTERSNNELVKSMTTPKDQLGVSVPEDFQPRYGCSSAEHFVDSDGFHFLNTSSQIRAVSTSDKCALLAHFRAGSFVASLSSHLGLRSKP